MIPPTVPERGLGPIFTSAEDLTCPCCMGPIWVGDRARSDGLGHTICASHPCPHLIPERQGHARVR